MITMQECTDCHWCANFSSGSRLICIHPTLPPNEVCKYLPIGKENAENCKGYKYGLLPLQFSSTQWKEAEDYSILQHEEVTYEGILEWIKGYTGKH